MPLIGVVDDGGTCPISSEELLLNGNLTIRMTNTLLHRYENQLLELQTYSENLMSLNDAINNIKTEKEDSQPIPIFFNCSSFAEFLTNNLNDLEFKRSVHYLL